MIALTLLASPAPAATPDDAAARAAVARFAQAADARDVGALEAALHPEFRVTFTMAGKPGVTVMSRDAYLGAAKAGKIGGDTRALTVDGVRIVGDLAFVHGKLVGQKARFDGTWTLARTAEGWRVVHDAVVFRPVKS